MSLLVIVSHASRKDISLILYLWDGPHAEDIGSFRGELLERLQEKREGL